MSDCSSDVHILRIDRVPTATLLSFYKDVFSDRSCSPSENWEWLYRVGAFEDRTALVVQRDEHVIAQAGMIPFWLSVRGKKVTAAWYVDLAVRPEIQRSGFGGTLTLEWMKRNDIHVTFCNERSMGLFRKLGWV